MGSTHVAIMASPRCVFWYWQSWSSGAHVLGTTPAGVRPAAPASRLWPCAGAASCRCVYAVSLRGWAAFAPSLCLLLIRKERRSCCSGLTDAKESA